MSETTRKSAGRRALVSALVLAAFAAVTTGLLSYLHALTRDRIAEEERRATLEGLYQIVPAKAHDNDMFKDALIVRNAELLGSKGAVTVYRARKNGKPVAVVLPVVSHRGYAGDIHMLVGVNADGTVAGVRVTAHRETPGVGDGIELDKSDWILGFNGKSLGDPPPDRWTVKKSGGAFDQLSSATITPRAVVLAVKDALVYFERHKDLLLAPAESPP